ncbi:acyltransferase family protein [Pseudomonas nitroreducens]|uniref:acyltransferase family protein n=1 Tax=Pseudomonas nitroreducens TaxID=46680 RepID=UPI0026595E43|nr:acyltransferase [Pseudomonas nitroreducens]MCP1648313.1 peptidoglycan/LPS O-acetylase OafA/YrhL [Pseudomonas nitroreducens]MCP1686888.1 peptidoglycan/LPS O-acetylase OafA/YrhL [Pseudomonas nitroreducens]
MTGAGRLRVLDDLRGVAITLVVVMHATTAVFGTSRPAGDPFWSSFVFAGGSGVTLFFMLSGFLVGRPFLRAAREGVSVNLVDYGVQRALRILPLYYLVGLIGMLWTGTLNQALNVLTFRAHDLDVGEYSTVWWSLQAEVQFYLALPLLYMVYRSRVGRWLFPLMLVAGVLFFLAFIFGHIPMPSIERAVGLTMSLLGRSPAFVAGMLIAYVYERNAIPRLPALVAWPLLAAAVWLLQCVLQHLLKTWGPFFALHYPPAILLESGAWALILLIALASGRPLLGRASVVLRYLGRISFSLYLLHVPIQYVLLAERERFAPVDDSIFFLLIVMFAILASQLTYSMIERPMLRLKDRLRSTPIAPEIA